MRYYFTLVLYSSLIVQINWNRYLQITLPILSTPKLKHTRDCRSRTLWHVVWFEVIESKAIKSVKKISSFAFFKNIYTLKTFSTWNSWLKEFLLFNIKISQWINPFKLDPKLVNQQNILRFNLTLSRPQQGITKTDSVAWSIWEYSLFPWMGCQPCHDVPTEACLWYRL